MIRDPNQFNPTLEPKQQTQVNCKKTKPRANQAITNKEKMPMTPKSNTHPQKFLAKSKTTVGQNSKGPLTIPMQNHLNPSQTCCTNFIEPASVRIYYTIDQW